MRWAEQAVHKQEPTLQGMPGFVRAVWVPEFEGVTFHEVHARKVLNSVPRQAGLPFQWTVNPYRGCTHGCTYCFARRTHEYLDLDAGADFDRQVVVKVNAPEVLAGQLRSGLRTGKWRREHVAMGTNTDPYQRAEGRYELMPGIIDALVRARTPFSILTKGTLLARDIPLLAEANERVDVGVAVSMAMPDRVLQRSIEPGTPSPSARLALVRKVRAAGLGCAVFLAPVLPMLTDSPEQLESMIAAVAEAGASSMTVLPLHLRPGAREWFLRWLRENRPDLVREYEWLYRRGNYVDPAYRRRLQARVRPLLERYGLDTEPDEPRGQKGEPRGSPHEPAQEPGPFEQEQLALL